MRNRRGGVVNAHGDEGGGGFLKRECEREREMFESFLDS